MFTSKQDTRNKEIYDQWVAGVTQANIGRAKGLSRQRIRQLLCNYESDHIHPTKRKLRPPSEKALAFAMGEFLHQWHVGNNAEVNTLALKFNLFPATVKSAINKHERSLRREIPATTKGWEETPLGDYTP